MGKIAPLYDWLTGFCRTQWVYLLFFVLPLFIYYPLFEPGTVLQGGTDLLYGHYPDLIYEHHLIRSGDFGVWNHLIYSGMDFSNSFLNNILYPLNWPMLAVPDRYVLQFLSWQLFFEICACGCLAYVIAGLILHNVWARLLVAIIVELGGFMWFNVTTFIGVHLTMASLVAAYFILTPERRRPLTTFVLSSFSFAGITLIGHPGYLLGFGVVLVGVFVAKFFAISEWRNRRAYSTIVFASGGVALMLSLYRIVPVFLELSQHSDFVGQFWHFAPYNGFGMYYIIAGLIPGMFGLDIFDSVSISRLVTGVEFNNQANDLSYYGIAAFFLAYLALFHKGGRRAFVAALIAFALISVYFSIQPISDMLFLSFWPIVHGAVPKTASYFAILALILLTLRYIETDQLSLTEREVRIFLAIVAIVLAGYITFVAAITYARHPPNWQEIEYFLKLPLIAVLGVGFGIVITRRASAVFFARMTDASVIAFGCLIAATVYFFWRYPGHLGEHMVRKTLFSDIGAVASVVLVISVARLFDGSAPRRTRDRVFLCVSGFMVAFVLFVPIGEGFGGRRFSAALFTGLWSAGVFFVASVGLAELFARDALHVLDRRLLIFLLTLLTIGDLLFFDRVYEYVNGPPFVSQSEMYPPAELVDPKTDRAAWNAAASESEMLVNHSLAMANGAVTGWSKGGGASSVEAVGIVGMVKLVNRGNDFATLFQDVVPNADTATVSFGVWIRSDTQARPEILVTGGNGQGGTLSYDDLGSGHWEWLSVIVRRPATGWKWVRAHVVLTKLGLAEIYAPHLVAGPYVKPWASPNGDIAKTRSLETANHYPQEEALDLKDYRASNPDFLFGMGQLQSNIPMIYGIPTYGGLDSDVPADYLDFLQAFDPDPHQQRWYLRAGIVTEIHDARVLDLLGVRYDIGANYYPHSGEGLTIRPNALPRFSVFTNYEIIADRNAAIARLKDPAFDPTTTVVLDQDPGSKPGVAQHFAFIPYQERKSDLIHVPYEEASPSILLFDDTFSPLWRADVDGARLPIYRGDVNFMAVRLPAGKHTLTLSFEPTEFFTLVKISASAAALLLLVAGYLVVTAGFSRWTKRAYS